MNEHAKISDLTVAEFRALMQQCFDADRKEVKLREIEDWERTHYERIHGYGSWHQRQKIPLPFGGFAWGPDGKRHQATQVI